MTKNEFVMAAEKTAMPKIKIGNHPNYADIWVVNVNGRVFCRQFSKNEKGWYAAILKSPKAHIKMNGSGFNVIGKVPEFSEALSKEIGQAYLKKYGRRFHWFAVVAWLMSRRKRWSKTVELVLDK